MKVYDILNKLNIEYEELEHKAVFTIEEAMNENIPGRIDGVECKNLFVKNKKNFYLIFMNAEKRADLKSLAKLVEENKLAFASEQQLKEILDLGLGSVTPLGIINDKENLVTLIIDGSLKGNKVLMHPNVNTKTISIKFKDLIKIVEYTQHKYMIF